MTSPELKFHLKADNFDISLYIFITLFFLQVHQIKGLTLLFDVLESGSVDGSDYYEI